MRGAGNIASVHQAVTELGGRTDDTFFTTPAQAASELHAAGFIEVSAWLAPEPTAFTSTGALETFLASVVLRHQLAALADEESRARFLSQVAARLPNCEIDYVRLNLDATRS